MLGSNLSEKSRKWDWQGLLGLLEERLMTAWGTCGKSRKLRDLLGHFQVQVSR